MQRVITSFTTTAIGFQACIVICMANLKGPFDEGVCLNTAALNKHLLKRHLLSKIDSIFRLLFQIRLIGDCSTHKSYLGKQSKIAILESAL